MIIFCPKCARKIDVDNQYYGSSAQCPTCGALPVITAELIRLAMPPAGTLSGSAIFSSILKPDVNRIF